MWSPAKYCQVMQVDYIMLYMNITLCVRAGCSMPAVGGLLHTACPGKESLKMYDTLRSDKKCKMVMACSLVHFCHKCENDMLRSGNLGLKMGSLAWHSK